MKVYVVNLPKDVERRQHVEQQLEQAGLCNYEIVPGVVASEMTAEEIQASFDFKRAAKNRTGCPTMPEIGCAIAHWRVWKKIAESGEIGLVLEDDVILKPGFKAWAETIIREMPIQGSWAVVASRDPVVKKHGGITSLGLYRSYICWDAHCYLMPPCAAERLTLSKPFTVSDNWTLFQSLGLQVFSGFNFPVTQDKAFDSRIVSRSNQTHALPIHVRAFKFIGCLQFYEKLWLRAHACIRNI